MDEKRNITGDLMTVKEAAEGHIALVTDYESLDRSMDRAKEKYLRCKQDFFNSWADDADFLTKCKRWQRAANEYLRWAQQKGRYIVEDDYDSEFSVLKKPEDTLFSQSEDDNIIYVNTFSKSISPSLRVGYMLLPKHLVPLFREKLGFYSCTVPTAIQYVLTELFRNGDFERHINRVRRAKRKDTQH